MHRPLASCLLVALLAATPLRLTAERLKVQVVQTHTGIKLGIESAADPGNADPPSTRCDRESGTYAKGLGFYCHGAAVSGDPAPANGDAYMFFDISVVMPDSTRAVFHCSTILNGTCEGFPEYPQNTSVVCSDFVSDGRAYKDCTASASSPEGIGVYEVALHGDRMTLFGPHWQRHYLKYGTWEYPGAPGANPKPVTPADPNNASTPDPQPATLPDAKPATHQDLNAVAATDPPADPAQNATGATAQAPQPPTPQEPKPAPTQQPAAVQETNPATTQESKPAAPTETKPASATPPAPANDHTPATQPVAVADLPVDPTVVEQAKAGDMVAQYKLGYDYYLGRGVALDYVQAAIWWRKSADQGYPAAQNNLGVLYNAGKGVPQSYEEAYFWQNLAAARASAGPLQIQFAKNRDESASRLWLFERRKVQKRAAEWAAAHPVPARSQEPRQAKD